MKPRKKRPLAERLAEQSRLNPETGCIEFTGYRVPKGYGLLADGRRGERYAHRNAWRAVHGEIPAGMFVCHRCDNPPCINVDHLFLGTPSDNMVDMHAKGRSRLPMMRGEEHPATILTEAQVLEIFRAPGGYRAIAKRYGVVRQTVGNIKNGYTWGHVTGAVPGHALRPKARAA